MSLVEVPKNARTACRPSRSLMPDARDCMKSSEMARTHIFEKVSGKYRVFFTCETISENYSLH